MKDSPLKQHPLASMSPFAPYSVGNNASNRKSTIRKNQERLVWKNWPTMLQHTLTGIKKNMRTILVSVNLLFGPRSKNLRSAIKKTLIHPKANDQLRTDFQESIAAYEQEGRTIAYLDESGFAQDMPRTHGYSKKGKRCFGTHDWHAKGRINAIGVIINFAFLTVALFKGSINADVFYAWLKLDFLPKVKPKTVIVMDNASFHKRADIIKAIENHGCVLKLLPPYSPDLNPIERKWAQAKYIRRKTQCSVNTLFQKYAIL